ncbi:hypothetical protein LCGC14_1935260 [marine sediment metagenome]|uniref:Uncharacterized protein n=1 Tax=marine sediment metagenome TaxID=412755 RepID=A0A0F9IJG5_9ZZZZ
MTGDYREALELTTLDTLDDKKTPDTIPAQRETVINSVPIDTPVTMQSIIKNIKNIKNMGSENITNHQIKHIIAQAVRDGTIIKSSNILDGRRRLYRRTGVMG